MKLSDIVRLVKSEFFWDIKNYEFNKSVDKFIRTLIEHKDEVEILARDPFYIGLVFRGRAFSIWIANRPYAYLSRILEHKIEDGIVRFKLTSNSIKHVRASRIAELDFYETFDKPTANRHVENEARFLESVCKVTK